MPETHKIDALLIGGGIMSATLGTMLKALEPNMEIEVVEQLGDAGMESSHALNNAGTGHASLCELYYTPETADGSVVTGKAFHTYEAFEQSKQFWAYLKEQAVIDDLSAYIRGVPHLSFVSGDTNVRFLKKRFDTLSAHHFFQDMAHTTDWSVAERWAPLMIESRDRSERIAFTKVEGGTDVDFGGLARALIAHLGQQNSCAVHFRNKVTRLRKTASGWSVRVQDLVTGRQREIRAKFVFIGAGGGAIPLLQKAGIAEGKGYGGFPVGGQWLICNKPEIVERHQAKVYGRPAVGAPAMTAPHLDTRYIGGQRHLIFGPFAGFSPKFLKHGSQLDLLRSIRHSNLGPMLAVGKNNMDMTRYLIGQVLQSHADRVEALRAFIPDAREEDWRLENAGQRVQIIKPDAQTGGKLQFGTEVVAARDGSLGALLGASPGASTAAHIMLEVLEKCFPQQMESPSWKRGIEEMIPSYRVDLRSNAVAFRHIHERVDRLLGVDEIASIPSSLATPGDKLS